MVLRYIPSIHQRIAFAEEVRRAVVEFKPDCIAVELPPFLKEWIVRGVLRLPQVSAVCYPAPENPGEMHYVPIDPCDSMIEAVRLALERELNIVWLDTQPGPIDQWIAHLPDDFTVERIGLEKYIEAILPYISPGGELTKSIPVPQRDREIAMAERLHTASRQHERILCVLGIAHFEAVRRLVSVSAGSVTDDEKKFAHGMPGAFLAHVHPKSLPEIFREIPHVAHLRESARDADGENPQFEKLDALRNIFKRAERKYKDEYKAEINLTRFKSLFQFTRNLAFTSDRLQPDTYEMVMGAKSCVDGDYGYEVYQISRSYPFQEEESSLPTLTLKNSRGTFSDRDQKFKMTPAFGEVAMDQIKLRFRRRPTMELKEQWKEEWSKMDMRGICSWPPEDERQEKFMMHVRKRALSVVSSDKKRVLEFTTSILDGLDIRETMRNWHQKKLYVQETPQPQGKVGAVVIIFDDPANDARYPWHCTLYAENQNESDITFYATSMGGDVVGPRICKTEFGGILSIYPSTRIPDIFSFPDVEPLKKCGDIILAAAFLFSADRYVAYVAPKPPSSLMRNLAAQYKKHIIYLPIAGFSPAQIKKVRMFHILNGRDVRNYAGDYIFDE